MVESATDPKREAFLTAIERAREDGLSLDDMASMITAAADIERANGSVPHSEPEDVMYDPGNLPEGLISLPDASKKYGIPVRTLRSWVNRGKLPKSGRVRARAAGGGYILTVDAMIEYCRDHPRKPGPRRSASS